MRTPHVFLATVSLATAVVLVATAADASAAVPTKSKLASTLLKRSDMPSGWTSQAPASNVTPANAGAIPTPMARCLGLSTAAAKPNAFAVGSYFSKGEDSIGSSAASYSSATALRKDVAAVRSKKYGTCYESFVKSEMTKSGLTVKKATLHTSSSYQGAPRSVIREADLSITASISGQTIYETLGQVVVSGDHTLGDVAVGTPTATAFPASTLHAATKKVATRIARL